MAALFRQDDGNLSDVCAIAALCSLLHFRKAQTRRNGSFGVCLCVCVFVFEGYCTCFGMAVRGNKILGLPIFNTRVVARMTLLGERLQNAEPGLLSLSCVWGVRLAQHVAWPRGHRGFDRAMGQFSPCQADVEVTGDSARAFSTEECQTQSLPAVGACKHAQGPSISLFE